MLIKKKININLFYYLFSSLLLIFIFLNNDLNSFEDTKYQLSLLVIVFIISIFTENYKENILLKILIFHFFIFYIFRIPFSIIQDNQIFDIRYVNQIEIKNSIINLIFQYISIYVAIFVVNPQINFNSSDKGLKDVDQNLAIINFILVLTLSIMFLNFLFNLFGTINYDNYSKYLAILFNIFNSKRLSIVFFTLIFFVLIKDYKIKNLKYLIFIFIIIYIIDTIYLAGSRSGILHLCLLLYLLSLYYLKLEKISLKLIIISILFLPIILISYFLSTVFKALSMKQIRHTFNHQDPIDFFTNMFDEFFSIIFIGGTDRIAYLNFYIEKLSNKRMYENIINLNYYFKSFVDRVTPGIDFFNVPLAAKDMQRSFSNKAFEEGLLSEPWNLQITNSEQITIFAESQILYGHFSILFYFTFFFILKIVSKIFKNTNIIYQQLINSFIFVLFFDWITGFGLDFFSINVIYSSLFLIIIIFTTVVLQKFKR
ncbi:MAG: hypothetical protein CMF54_07245 [Legionellales bacterium]|nr:hypothetical protein [Legionellales bacterium]|tara:strand:- start:6642 stop:8093 length:1452 start_codon:yes stop_codon:yes gene_type:complete